MTLVVGRHVLSCAARRSERILPPWEMMVGLASTWFWAAFFAHGWTLYLALDFDPGMMTERWLSTGDLLLLGLGLAVSSALVLACAARINSARLALVVVSWLLVPWTLGLSLLGVVMLSLRRARWYTSPSGAWRAAQAKVGFGPGA